jgi:hypothetical protein
LFASVRGRSPNSPNNHFSSETGRLMFADVRGRLDHVGRMATYRLHKSHVLILNQ